MADGVAGAFIPASADVPSYMIPMLNDSDRNTAYEAAIRETLERFQKEQGRAPRVLDLGAGTGLLTLIALKHGAAHVTALEANETVQGISAEQIQASVAAMGRDAADYELVGGLSVLMSKDGGAYDMVISELLGSMVNSESQYIYVWDLLMRGVINNFGSKAEPKFYTVPQSGTMTMRLTSAADATGIVTGIPYAPMNKLYEAVYDRSFVGETARWTQDEEMRVCLADIATPASDAVVVLHEQYDMVSGGVKHPGSVELRVTDQSTFVFEHAVLALEWTVQLSATVTLLHTLDHVAKLPLPVKVARWIAWGHLFAPLSECVGEANAGGTYRFSIKYRPDGLDVTAEPASRRSAPAAAAAAAAPTAPAADASAGGENREKRRRVAPTLVAAVRPPASGGPGGEVLVSHIDLAKFVMITKMLAERGVTSV